MSAIYRKEMRIYLSGMFGWAIMAVLLFFLGLFTAMFHLLSGFTNISYTLTSMHWVMIVSLPFLTMRSIAEERHTRTDQLLYSLPVRQSEVVAAKYLAACTVFLLPTAVYALYPLILSGFGSISLISAYTALFGYILLGMALIVVSLFVSSLVENQILAAVLSIVAMLVIYFMSSISMILPTGALASFLLCILAALGIGALVWHSTKNLTVGMVVSVILILPTSAIYIIKADLFEALVPKALFSLDLFTRFGGFSYGRFDLPATLLYLSLIGFFLFLTVRSMEKRRLI